MKSARRIRKRYVALLTVLLIVGFIGWRVFVIATAKPGPLVDYVPQLIALSENYQPTEGENGWPALSAALEKYSGILASANSTWPVPSDSFDANRIRQGTFDRDRFRYELAFMDSVTRSGVLEELNTALSAPRFVRTKYTGIEEGLLDLQLPELGRSRAIARVRGAAMRAAAADGDWTRVEQAWIDLMRLSRAVSFEPCVISQLVSMSISEVAADELAKLLVEYRIDEGLCRRILAALNMGSARAPFQYAIEGDRLLYYDLIQRTHTDNGHHDGLLVMDALEYYAENDRWSQRYTWGGIPAYRFLGMVKASRAETTRALDTFIDAVARQATMSRSKRRADSVDLGSFVDELPEQQVFLRLLLPSYGRALLTQDIYQTRVNALKILLAIEIYEIKHGQLPNALGDLAPDCLTEEPDDLVSEKPFTFVRRDATADDPRPFLLYSFGADGIDNGGVEYGTGDTEVALRTMSFDSAGKSYTNGFDFVFNRLRDPVDEVEQ